jgi:hypothetical protein
MMESPIVLMIFPLWDAREEQIVVGLDHLPAGDIPGGFEKLCGTYDVGEQ